MKQEYQKMQEQILPDREKQDEIWSVIERKATKRQSKFSHRYVGRLIGGIAAAILICVLFIPQTGVADGVKSFLNQYFDKSANVKEDIVENVYEDSDGHVKMQVTKMLSDGAWAYLDICYEALDDKGKDWLSGKKMDQTSIQFLYKGDIVGKTNGYSMGLEEYKDMATEQARYFNLAYKDYSGNFNLNEIERILSYPMCKEKREVKIKVSSNIDTFAYRLEGEGSPSKFYTPEYLIISKFSYGIFGQNQGVYTRLPNGEAMTEDFLASPDIDNVFDISFTMKDGKKVKTEHGMSCSPAKNITGYDLLVNAGYFYNDDDNHFERHTAINPDALAGIEIDGVYYDLVPDSFVE